MPNIIALPFIDILVPLSNLTLFQIEVFSTKALFFTIILKIEKMKYRWVSLIFIPYFQHRENLDSTKKVPSRLRRYNRSLDRACAIKRIAAASATCSSIERAILISAAVAPLREP